MAQGFRAQLVDQLALLRIAAGAFDNGEEVAAKALATTIRVLVHDTRSSTSLLTHLGVKDQLPYRDTAPADAPAGVITRDCGLCVFQIGTATQEVTYRPPLDDVATDRQHPPACFDDWWNIPVLRDTATNEFSRKALVLAVANKDGGAHVDGALPSDYEALTRANSLGFGQVKATEPNVAGLAFSFEGLRQKGLTPAEDSQPLTSSIALASVRQIAHELASTLGEHLVETSDGVAVSAPICALAMSSRPQAGRNDPCPCGSGRKLKHCFGVRLPRRRAPLPPRELPPLP